MALSTMDNGARAKGKAMEYWFGKTEAAMKDNGIKTAHKDKEN
jgi:hypothetical protein